MSRQGPVLLSWVGAGNDPYEREIGSTEWRRVNGDVVPGPTLTLLQDPASPFSGKIRDFVLFCRAGSDDVNAREARAVTETVEALRALDPPVEVRVETWSGDDPTDHRGIFEFLRDRVPAIRKEYQGRELIIHASPGTPAMHTIWVLMAETGYVEAPFRIVKTYRPRERKEGRAVALVEVGIETFYKAYRVARPQGIASDEQRVVWDPAKFAGDRMRALFREARRFAALNVPVLIVGERGTGKTTLASWIRLHSPHRREELDTGWPAVPCGQYSSETMRAELFGHRKGAFTGATKARTGLLAKANGDTLFLDEIGDISVDVQRLLIKALEEKRYQPMGGQRFEKSDFRLITATNIPEAKLLERLDADFLDRVALLTLRIPPLREVREELAWLWPSVFRQAAQRAVGEVGTVALAERDEARLLGALKEHPLPGNLRDLFQVAFRVVAALADPHEPLSGAAAVAYGLDVLSARGAGFSQADGLGQCVAERWASGRGLDDLIGESGFATREVLAELRRFMAGELRRVAKARGIPADEISDRSGRALLDWMK